MRTVFRFFWFVLLVCLSSTHASAFCRATTCDDVQNQSCNEGQTSCLPQKWKSGCFGYTVDFEGSRTSSIDYETASELVRSGILTWLSADCGGGRRPSIEVYDLGPSYCDEHEYYSFSGNANSWTFRDDRWPYSETRDTYAVTFTHFDDTGAIHDADVEINAVEHSFALDGEKGVDLRAVITHETGHVLGLNHSEDANAVMFANYAGRRVLGSDDVAAICALYPPETPRASCVSEPKNGLFRGCGESQIRGHGCSSAPAPAPVPMIALLFPVMIISMRARRSSRVR